MNLIGIFSLVTFISFNALAISRIDNFKVDRKKVSKIFLSYSKASVVRFPDTIEEVRLGLPNFYSADVSKTYARELTLFLKQKTPNPSNLIVRTTDGSIYVFDLVASDFNHQDVVFVDESFYKSAPKIQKKSQERTYIKTSKRRLIFTNKKRKRIKL